MTLQRLSVPIICTVLSVILVLSPFYRAASFETKEIYPPKDGTVEWNMNSDDLLNDSRLFFLPNDSFATRNEDGSWHIGRQDLPANEGVRINVQSPEGIKWRDIEMTAYVKLTSYSSLEGFSWRLRSGTPHVDTCHGTGYYTSLRYDGSKADITKELWHGSGGEGYARPKGVVRDITEPLENRWVGIKAVIYNLSNGKSVKIELWLDDKASNDWKKITDTVDHGDWKVRHLPKDVGLDVTCRNPLTNEPIEKDEIILWGGTQVTFRADNASFDFKNLSVREIQRD